MLVGGRRGMFAVGGRGILAGGRGMFCGGGLGVMGAGRGGGELCNEDEEEEDVLLLEY